MAMHSPVHPGRIIRDAIEDLNLSVTDAARFLNVARSTLSSLLNGRSGVSPEMAVRLSKAIGSTPGFWLRLQLNYDLAQVKQWADTIQVNPMPSHHHADSGEGDGRPLGDRDPALTGAGLTPRGYPALSTEKSLRD